MHVRMYTGLDCTAFNMLKWLEPVLPVYGSNPEEMQAMQHGVHAYLTTSQMLLMTLIRMHRSLLQEDLAVVCCH